MCGIAGCILRTGSPDLRHLEAAVTQLRHRGPNDSGIHINGPVGLAHTRLSIIDLAGGHQPITSLDNRFALVANGEIYNYIELQVAQRQQGCVFKTQSDSETILYAWSRYQSEGLKQLNGMFAFALHDQQHNELILARDRLGIKPLYYSVLPDRIVFASEIKALLPLLDHAPAIHSPALLQFLQNQFSSGRETIFKNIHRVLPGECLRIDRDLNIEHHIYWRASEIETRQLSADEAMEEMEPLLLNVMRQHMRSDVPFGLFLSGGVDSAILLSLLSELMSQPLKTYSVGYRGVRMRDELDDAMRIARHFGSDHHVLELDREQIFSRIVHSTWAADDLMRDYASLPTSLLSQRAAQDLRVVFSGEGGDESFAGYRRYRNNFEARIKSLLRPGSGGFRTRGQWHDAFARKTFSAKLKQSQPAVREPFICAWQQTPDNWSYLQRAQYTDLTTALPDNLLVKADRMMMAFGLEGRVPFVDHRIVEFGLSLPDTLKLQHGQGKWLLKRWAEKRIPADHLYRPKRGFHVPAGEWLQGEFLQRLEQKLLAHKAVTEWFQPDGIRAMFQAQQRKGNATREIWCLMQFAIWHRLFVEQPGIMPSPDENPLDWI